MTTENDFQAPQDGDAKQLHAALLAQASADGVFNRNLQPVAAELGWTPDRLSTAMQELVAQDLVLPDHPDGRADRIASARWLVIGDHKPERVTPDDADPIVDLDEMTLPQLREYAEGNDIDLGDATKKAEVRAAIDAHEAEASA